MATPEPDERADVDRVLRDVHDVRERGHDGDAADDRQPADAHRQDRGDRRTEHEEQDDERERQRDDLGAKQIVLERPVQIEHEGNAAGAVDGEDVRSKPPADLRVVPQRLLKVAAQMDNGDLRPSRSVDHRVGVLRRDLVGREDRVDLRIVRQRSERVARCVRERRVVRV